MELKILLSLYLIVGAIGSSSTSNPEPANALNKIIEEAQVAITNSFEKRIQQLIRDKFQQGTSEDSIMLLKISLDSPSLLRFEYLEVVQKNQDAFLVAISKTLISVFAIEIFEEINLHELVSINRLDILSSRDHFSVLLEKDLWIFEASLEAEMVIATKIFLNETFPDVFLQQVIPDLRAISDIHSFSNQNVVSLVVVSQKDSRAIIRLFSYKDSLQPVLNASYCCTSKEVDIRRIYSEGGLTYFISKCGKNSTVFLYNKMTNTFSSIQEFDGNVTDSLFYHDELSQKLFLILIKQQKAEIYWFKKIFLKLKEFFIESEIQNGIEFSSNFRNYLVFSNQVNISIYNKNIDGSFKLMKNYRSACGNYTCIKILSIKNMNLVFSCQSESGRNIRFGQISNFRQINPARTSGISSGPTELHIATQMDSPKEKVEKCLSELKSMLKQHKHTVNNLRKFVTGEPNLNESEVLFRSVLLELPKVKDMNLPFQPQGDFLVQTSRIGKLSSKVMELGKRMKDLEAELPSLMTFEGDQHIRMSVEIPKLTANYSNILWLDQDKLNGVPWKDFKIKFLLLDGDQLVTTNFYFDKVITKNINTDMLTDNTTFVSPNDLLDSKNSGQVVTGRHSFLSLEVKNDVFRFHPQDPIEMNGIKSDELVTTFSDVVFGDFQSFSKPLTAKHEANIQYLNKESYVDWTKSVIRFKNDSSMVFDGYLVITGNVLVMGDVKVASINGLNIREMYENAAKKSNLFQSFKGSIEFTNALKIRNSDLMRINNVAWNDFLRLKNSEAKAKFYIDEGVVLGDVNSNLINRLDFDKDLLLSGADQTVIGVIVFESDVTVSGNKGITMDIGAVINDFDPSLYSFHPDFQDVISYEVNFVDLQIKGDVRITKINGIPFPDFETSYWRKSTHQKIPVDVQIHTAVFENSLYASTLNGYKVKDYLFTDVDQVVKGKNFFMNNVTVLDDFDVNEHKRVDGVDLSVLRDSAVTLHGMQTLYGGKKFLKGMNIQDLRIKDGLLHDIKIEEELFGNSRLYPGKLIFEKPVMVRILHVKEDLKLEENGKKIEAILLGSAKPISKIKGIVTFDDLEVNDVKLWKNLNGMYFNEWIKTTVSKTDSPLLFTNKLYVKGHVTFAGSFNINKINSLHVDHLTETANDCDGCMVRGKKIFKSPLKVMGNLKVENINGVNLNILKERLLSRTKEQNIEGKYILNAGVTVVAIKTAEISGFAVDEIALTNALSEIKGATIFKSDVLFNELQSTGLIDGCTIEEVLSPPVMKAGNFITSNISLGHLKIEGNVTVRGRLLSGPKWIDVVPFLQRVVMKSKYQEIIGFSEFRRPVHSRSMTTKKINYDAVDNFLNKLSMKQINLVSDCDLEFEELSLNKIISKDLVSEDILINNRSLKEVSDLGIKRHNLKLITGRKEFLGAAISKLRAENIGDVRLKNIIKLNHKYIDGDLVFTKPIFIDKNLEIRGTISETEPDIFLKSFVSTKTYPNLFPPIYNRVIVDGDFIGNSINGQRLDDVFVTSAETLVITGKKTVLGGIILDGEARIDRINEIDMNLFRKWSDKTLPSKSIRYGLSIQGNEDDGIVLKNIAFELRHLNSINYGYAEGLHKTLFYITEEDREPIHGIVSIRKFYIIGPQSIYAITEYEACMKSKQCACFETHTFKINGYSKLEYGRSIKGEYIPVTSQELEELESLSLTFYSRCLEGRMETTVTNFINYKNGTELLLTEKLLLTGKNESFGIVQNVLTFHSRGMVYFVVLVKTIENNVEVNYVKVMKQNFQTLWKTRLTIATTAVDLKKICDVWYLLITGGKLEEYSDVSLKDETLLYTWDEYRDQFDLYGSFPAATSGEIISFGSEAFLVLGQNENSPSFKCEEGNLKIYRAEKCSVFTPFNTLLLYGISSTTSFVEGKDLYLVAASTREHGIKIFKRFPLEGFKEVYGFSVGQPTAVRHLERNGTHFLVVASHKSSVILLKIQFQGRSFHRVKHWK